MRKGIPASIAVWVRTKAQFLGSALFAVYGAVTEIDPNHYAGWAKPLPELVAWLKDCSLILLLLTGCAFFLSLVAAMWRDPWILKKLQYILDALQKEAYENLQHELHDHHRVTIFEWKRWHLCFRKVQGRRRWPWSGWLVPVLRSGHTSQNSNAIFLAPDDGIPEGIAGQAWGRNSTAFIDDLPELTCKSAKKAIKKYSDSTYCSEAWIVSRINSGRSLPRSIGGMPIMVNGVLWGVLVLDSQNPKGVTEEVMGNFELTVDIIGQLLEKA